MWELISMVVGFEGMGFILGFITGAGWTLNLKNVHRR